MSDTYGPTFYAPLGKWDRASQSWKTSEATSLWALTLSSLTLPTWGGLHDGELFEHPTPELATSALDYSSLPTPVADNSRGLPQTGTDYASLPNAVIGLLPTPNAADGNGGGRLNSEGHQRTLPGTVRELPTPTSRDWKGHNQRGDDTCLTGALLPTPTSQAAKHGETPDTTANGFGSNLWDLPHLLPTPATANSKSTRAMTASTDNGRRSGGGQSSPPGLEEMAAIVSGHWPDHMPPIEDLPPATLRSIGATTAPPSPDGSTSSDDAHQPQLNLDVQGIPA